MNASNQLYHWERQIGIRVYVVLFSFTRNVITFKVCVHCAFEDNLFEEERLNGNICEFWNCA